MEENLRRLHYRVLYRPRGEQNLFHNSSSYDGPQVRLSSLFVAAASSSNSSRSSPCRLPFALSPTSSRHTPAADSFVGFTENCATLRKHLRFGAYYIKPNLQGREKCLGARGTPTGTRASTKNDNSHKVSIFIWTHSINYEVFPVIQNKDMRSMLIQLQNYL